MVATRNERERARGLISSQDGTRGGLSLVSQPLVLDTSMPCLRDEGKYVLSQPSAARSPCVIVALKSELSRAVAGTDSWPPVLPAHDQPSSAPAAPDEDTKPKEKEPPLLIAANGRQIEINGHILQLTHAEAVAIRRLAGGIPLPELIKVMSPLRVPKDGVSQFLIELNNKIQSIAGRAIIGANEASEPHAVVVGLNKCLLQVQTPNENPNSSTARGVSADNVATNTQPGGKAI